VILSFLIALETCDSLFIRPDRDKHCLKIDFSEDMVIQLNQAMREGYPDIRYGIKVVNEFRTSPDCFRYGKNPKLIGWTRRVCDNIKYR
jgi:hypothetical protein